VSDEDLELRRTYAAFAMQALVNNAGPGLVHNPRETAYRISQTAFEVARMMVIVGKETEEDLKR
jgi:hypothetical protein